jgi:hypothetical protein
MLFSCPSLRLCDLCVKSFAVIALRANNVATATATATATTTTKTKAILFSQRSQSRRERQMLLELLTSFAVPYVIQLHFSAAPRALREKFCSYCSLRKQRCNSHGNSNHKVKGTSLLAEVAEPQRKTNAFGATYVVCRSICYSVALLCGSATSA